MNKEINIAIRELVEFVLMGGDLDLTFQGPNRGQEGTRGHQKLQKCYLPQDEAEVYIKHSVDYKNIIFNLTGRIDGVLKRDEGLVIDEIKTITIPVEDLHENYNQLHWAQGKCYGYIYALQNNLIEMNIQLTYYHIKTEEIKRYKRLYTLIELETFFFSLLEEYFYWADTIKQWETVRDESILNLEFPFESYRKGQRKMAVAVYKTIKEKKRVFIQAPTGIGKTISSIFPTVKAMAEGRVTKIFYLTAKTITRQVAEEAIYKMVKKGLRLKFVTLTAKDKICFEKESNCNPQDCSFAKGYYNRLKDALKEIFQRESYDRGTIEEYARKHSICPFEFSLELTLWSDCIICDYNYVFDPRVYLKRFFEDPIGNKYTLLVDEAHNLVDRARMMYSAEIYKGKILEGNRYIKTKNKEIAKSLNKLNSLMLDKKKSMATIEVAEKEEPVAFYPLMKKFITECDTWFGELKDIEVEEDFLQLYFDILAFLRIAEFYHEGYVTYYSTEDKDMKLKLFAMDPSKLLASVLKRVSSGVFFSATLTPMAYFKYILGGREEDNILMLESPFKEENLCLLVAKDISTRYYHRHESYEGIAEYIHHMVKERMGNYLVFFPSYKYMHSVMEVFVNKYPNYKIIKQETEMKEEEREAFLEVFKPRNHEVLIGFSVLGGIFSEGIDLVGDRLIGAMVVGVGLPQLSFETNLIKKYFDDTRGCGFDYAYKFPGMNKVLQAAGRVIRTEEDRGMVLLIDDRYISPGYYNLFPKAWRRRKEVNISNVNKDVMEFWKV
ncbi:ATP-dependent DNA helicase [Alkaliphilus serpentinus]|nr:ATP-dependent DNA helicase [Alkaliphilus serpentinus]